MAVSNTIHTFWFLKITYEVCTFARADRDQQMSTVFPPLILFDTGFSEPIPNHS